MDNVRAALRGDREVVRRRLRFDGVLADSGWIEPGYVELDDAGSLLALAAQPTSDSAGWKAIAGYAVPGYQNAHSHAFQYAMAGHAEHLPVGAAEDDFWSWREAMYGLALTLSPDEIEAIAAMLYAEMLRHGYTAVAEFHYLHHDPSGVPYANRAEIGQRLLAAAESAGIRLTLVPIFYQRGGFEQPATPRQRRFLSATLEEYQQLLEVSHEAVRASKRARIGVGVHSLRAVEPAQAIAAFAQADASWPRHLHVSEQRREVEECLAALGTRPVAWLADNLALDQRFHLVHATHVDADELARIAASGANVVLCPSTEGNLGDGFFPLRRFLERGGRFSIGTDSHVGLAPAEELRLLDYGQRLSSERRNVVCLEPGEDSGERLFSHALQSGRRAMGERDGTGIFRLGEPFDAAIYDADFPPLALAPAARRLSAIVYASDPTALLGTMVAGELVVDRGRHARGDELRSRYRKLARR